MYLLIFVVLFIFLNPDYVELYLGTSHFKLLNLSYHLKWLKTLGKILKTTILRHWTIKITELWSLRKGKQMRYFLGLPPIYRLEKVCRMEEVKQSLAISLSWRNRVMNLGRARQLRWIDKLSDGNELHRKMLEIFREFFLSLQLSPCLWRHYSKSEKGPLHRNR